jgi:hypothetical protein
MLRSALALLSSLQIGLRIKESVERSLRQAIVVAVAVVVLIIAAAFGLLAAYQALIAHGFTPAEAAGIVAASLALLGVLILATLPLFARKRKPQEPSMLAAGSEGVGLLDQGVGKAMQSVGPVTLLAIAFVAGLLASRRK